MNLLQSAKNVDFPKHWFPEPTFVMKLHEHILLPASIVKLDQVRNIIGFQAFVIGQTCMTWMVYDSKWKKQPASSKPLATGNPWKSFKHHLKVTRFQGGYPLFQAK